MLLSSVSALIYGVLVVSALPERNIQSLLEQNSEDDALLWNVRPDEPEPHPEPRPPHFPHPPPHHPHPPPKVDNLTIYQFLSSDPKFSRLFKLVNLTDDITSVLNDSSASVTFFAPPDWALRPPKRPRHPKHFWENDDDVVIDTLTEELSTNSDKLDSFAALEGLVTFQNESDDDGERKKEIFKKIVKAILSYHILPVSYSAGDLSKNTTYATSFNPQDGSLDGEASRLRVGTIPRLVLPNILVVNIYAKVVASDITTKNGIVHVVDHPLFPPPSAFQILFFLPDVFSTFTSALQRVGLADAADWRWQSGKGNGKGALVGSPSNTVFAPTNKAFWSLPRKLKAFLFSPFGEKVLLKLLQFHIVPDFVLHTDWSHNATESVRTQQAVVIDEYPAHGFEFSDRIASALSHAAKHPKVKTPKPQHEVRVSKRTLVDYAWEFSRSIVEKLFPTSQPSEEPHGCAHDSHRRPKVPHPDLPHPDPPSLPDLPHPEPPHPPHRRPEAPHPKPDQPPHIPRPEPIYSVNITVPTLLTEHPLNVHIVQFEYRVPILPHKSAYFTKLFANGQKVGLSDIVARNGAVHIIGKVLNPVKGHHKHGKHGHGHDHDHDHQAFKESEENEWEGWEDWLLKWADEE